MNDPLPEKWMCSGWGVPDLSNEDSRWVKRLGFMEGSVGLSVSGSLSQVLLPVPAGNPK